MFKRIPGNNDYLINLDGVIKTNNGTVIRGLNFLTLEFFGSQRTLSTTWLAHLAYFEITLTNPRDYKLVNFVEIKTVKREGISILPRFDRPIYHKRDYRIIPNFSKYAISEKGEIIRISDGFIVSIEKYRLAGYPVVNLYNPEQGKHTHLTLHRLIALTWVHNDDVFNKCNVNHLDGDKENYSRKNLEWTTPAENSLHAVEMGLREDNVPFELMEVDTLTVTKYPSISQACRAIGYSPKPYNDLPKHKLLCGRFKYRITGEDVWLPDLKDRPVKESNAVSAYNVLTKEMITADSIKALSRKIGVWYNSIVTSLNNDPLGLYYGKDNWVYRHGIVEEWCDDFKPNPTSQRKVFADNGEEQLIFKSMREASVYFGVDRSTVNNRLKTGNELKGYKLTLTAHH